MLLALGSTLVVQALTDRLGHVSHVGSRAVTRHLADFSPRPARCVSVGQPQGRSVGPVPCGVQCVLLGHSDPLSSSPS
jgi:hypothetical protein